jgi:hypothetical protein
MPRLTLLLGFSVFATSAIADGPFASPAYLGVRSSNPEQETYGTPVEGAGFARPSAFLGPARTIGAVTGEPEKDTFAYSSLTVDPEACRLLFTPVTDAGITADAR